jgi:FtsP/CotA-like multicopper oxidase with cupredoxin domain
MALRRTFLVKGAETVALASLLPATPLETCQPQARNSTNGSPDRDSLLVSTDTPADDKIHIGPALTEIKDQHVVSSTGYNGQAPGPVIRLKEGKQITVALINDTDVPEFADRHGQMIPSLADGAPEEKSYVVPPHGQLHYRFTPGPSGSRWLHSHAVAGSNLHLGTPIRDNSLLYISNPYMNRINMTLSSF